MHYVKIVTSGGETRWINLDQVARATLAKEPNSGRPVLALTFAGGSLETRLTITGAEEVDRKAIETITNALDAILQKN